MKKYLSILFLLVSLSAFALPTDSVTNYVAGLATNNNVWTGTNNFGGAIIDPSGNIASPGTFTGNGGGLTNLSDAQRANQELAYSGQSPFLSDFVSLCAAEGMTNATFRGQTLNYSNVITVDRGAKFNGNGKIWFNCNLQPTNTIAVVWWVDLTNQTYFGEDIMFQVGNTTNFDSESGMYNNGNGFTHFGMANNTVASPSGFADNNTLLKFQHNNSYPFGFNIQRRHVTLFSTDGHGLVKVWDNGNQCEFYNSSAFTLTYTNYPTSTNLNIFSIGTPAFTNGTGYSSISGGFRGIIESIFLFNKAADTNLIQAHIFASDWVQPFTSKMFLFGDSLFAQSAYNTNMGVKIDAMYADAGGKPIPFDYFIGGASSSGVLPLTNTLIFNRAHGKITQDIIEFGLGVNNSSDAGLIYSRDALGLYNSLAQFSPANVVMDIWDIGYPATNAVADALTPSAYLNMLAANSAFFTNRNVIRYDYQRSALQTPDMMVTNRVPRLTLDGLHFNDPTNGDSAYWMVAGLWIQNRTGSNPYMLTNLPYYYGDGGSLTNLNASQLASGTIPAARLNYRSGFTNIPTLTTSLPIVFSTPFSPTVGTNYWVGITFDSTLGAANSTAATAKTTNGFTLTLSATITGAQAVDYYAAPYQ